MATAVSPTPFALHRDTFRASSRPNIRHQLHRPALKRTSPSTAVQQQKSGLPQSWNFSVGDDSSEDEIPVPPIKFSAEAKALLGDEASVVEGSSPSYRQRTSGNDVAGTVEDQVKRKRSPPLIKSIVRTGSRSPQEQKAGTPRIVRLSISPSGTTVQASSFTSVRASISPTARKVDDLVTPAPRPRSTLSSRSGQTGGSGVAQDEGSSKSKPSSGGSALSSGSRTTIREGSSDIHEAALQMGNMSINRGRSEDPTSQGSLRVKKVGKVTGRFLAGPARRGMKRRQSEEDQSPVQEGVESPIRNFGQPGDFQELEMPNKERASPETTPEDPLPVISLSNPNHVRFDKQLDIITGSPRQPARRKDPIAELPAKTLSPILKPQSQEKPALRYKVPNLPMLPSMHDQENEPPPTFKRNKPNSLALLERQPMARVLEDKGKMLIDTPVTVSPARQPLAPRSQNTPHRAPPPPPKMTVLETATATAGAASASQNRKKRNYISVNGKLFTRMDCIGRGGSSKVYRVMAENYKIFALKRVTLEDQDPLAIQGYKGEIDLLRKLSDVDRVVQLFDWELNEEKKTLSVLMEIGESDLQAILKQRLEDTSQQIARLDLSFTRYFWKEMLECVLSIHAYDIVHSDLKPANFLLVKGRLKLIDFGIANAIQENTVNVHREVNVGTPNYMSPEALIDSNAANGNTNGHDGIVGKLMKLGKPSDVWSLGCILYQMTYGKPPFAHIANQMQRCMAIPNPRHEIAFPAKGVGGVLVPSGLIKTLRGCLNRDIKQRPILQQLLAMDDPFLHPESAIGTIEQRDDRVSVSEELIAKMQHYIVSHLREGQVSEQTMREWPRRFFESIKAQQEETVGRV